MDYKEPIIIKSQDLQSNLEKISFGYPDLSFEKQCKGQEFRKAANQIIHDVALKTMSLIEHPDKTAIALAWRSSLPFAESFKELGISNFIHFDISRDEVTLQPICTYISEIPEHIETIVISDPMLATAGTAKFMYENMYQENRNFIFTSLISAPEGIQAIQNLEKNHNSPIITARLDSHLDKKGYIVPGIGDFGDKWFYDLNINGYLNKLQQAQIISSQDKKLLIKRATETN